MQKLMTDCAPLYDHKEIKINKNDPKDKAKPSDEKTASIFQKIFNAFSRVQCYLKNGIIKMLGGGKELKVEKELLIPLFTSEKFSQEKTIIPIFQTEEKKENQEENKKQVLFSSQVIVHNYPKLLVEEVKNAPKKLSEFIEQLKNNFEEHALNQNKNTLFMMSLLGHFENNITIEKFIENLPKAIQIALHPDNFALLLSNEEKEALFSIERQFTLDHEGKKEPNLLIYQTYLTKFGEVFLSNEKETIDEFMNQLVRSKPKNYPKIIRDVVNYVQQKNVESQKKNVDYLIHKIKRNGISSSEIFMNVLKNQVKIDLLNPSDFSTILQFIDFHLKTIPSLETWSHSDFKSFKEKCLKEIKQLTQHSNTIKKQEEALRNDPFATLLNSETTLLKEIADLKQVSSPFVAEEDEILQLANHFFEYIQKKHPPFYDL